MTLTQLRTEIQQATLWDEHDCVEYLLQHNRVTDNQNADSTFAYFLQSTGDQSIKINSFKHNTTWQKSVTA